MATQVQSKHVETDTRLWPPQSRRERVVYAIIIGTGALCLVLLAWVHLGLGALLFPPTTTAQQQVAHAGNYTVTLTLGSGQLTAGGPNTLDLMVRDVAGQPTTAGQVRVHPVMTTMAMVVPTVSAAPAGAGAYTAHPKFGMAGTWRLDVVITSLDGVSHTASFTVNVRWN